MARLQTAAGTLTLTLTLTLALTLTLTLALALVLTLTLTLTLTLAPSTGIPSIAPSCFACFDYTNGLADLVVGGVLPLSCCPLVTAP